MDAISSCRILGFDHLLCSTSNTHIKINASVFSHSRSQIFKPNLGTRSTLPRLRISYLRNKGQEQCFRWPRISCLLGNINDESKETELSSDDSQQEAAIDLKLPRRSLLVTFTCDACGTRSQRLINRLAYERGLVYVQCAGCSQYHNLVDNLGLVVEYNLQEQIDLSANTDQI